MSSQHTDLEHEFNVEEVDMITLVVGGDEYGIICPHCAPSYFLYKPEIKKSEICYNSQSELCGKCKEPECEFSGRASGEKTQ